MVQIVTGDWQGLTGLGDELLAELRPLAAAAVRRAATFFASEVKKTLTGERHGKVYFVGTSKAARRAHRSRGKWVSARYFHQASAPGEPPAVLSGALRNSIGNTRPSWDGNTVSSEVGSGLGQGARVKSDPGRAYARRLEWGGYDSRGVYIAARPYMDPTAERVAPDIDRIFAEELDRATAVTLRTNPDTDYPAQAGGA